MTIKPPVAAVLLRHVRKREERKKMRKSLGISYECDNKVKPKAFVSVHFVMACCHLNHHKHHHHRHHRHSLRLVGCSPTMPSQN